MSGGTNNIKRPGYTPGGQNAGGWDAQRAIGMPTRPPSQDYSNMVGGGPGGVPPHMSLKFGQGGYPQPNPAQMEAWKKQFGGWNPAGQPQNQLTGLLGGGQQPQQFPGMNIPGLLAAGSGHPPGFPGYANLPKNWQDEGYSWQDPNNPDARYMMIA